MLGAIIGDIAGSVYERGSLKSTDFPLMGRGTRFTDDTVLTVAIAAALLEGNQDYATFLRQFGRRYPLAGYGGSFNEWLHAESAAPYGSYGNGSAMRVSPVGLACHSVEHVLDVAAATAAVTHNHPEGIKGAQATALAVFLARTGASKAEIKAEITERFAYDLSRRLDDIRPNYSFHVSCQESVPESLISFLESHDFESSIRNAISLGGDTDTMACIAGGVAQAFYKVIPEELKARAISLLPMEFLEIIQRFNTRFCVV